MSGTKSRVRSRMLKPPIKSVISGTFSHRDENGGLSAPHWYMAASYKNEVFPSGGSAQNDYEVTWDQSNPGPPFRSGGPFLKIRICNPSLEVKGVGSYKSEPGANAWWGLPPGHTWNYDGGFCNPQFMGNSVITVFPSDLRLIVPDLSDFSSKVYNKLRPNLEKASAFVFTSELRDLPRMLKTTAREFHDVYRGLTRGEKSPLNLKQMSKKGADDFLNGQFGWVPFVSDLQKFGEATNNHADYISRITRENNQWVHKKATMSNINTKVVEASGIGLMVEPINLEALGSNDQGNWFDGNDASWEQTLEINSRVWATGYFKYYRPEFDSSVPGYNSAWSAIQRDITLYGARISPSHVWQATPWTWLGDWVSDAGDTVKRIEDVALNGVVSRDMYLMGHSLRTVSFKQTINLKKASLRLTWDRFIDVKQRLEAQSPWGFNLSLGDLSPKQLGILGALGLTRMHP